MGMRWDGFRRVRRQVCRRIDKRRRELELESLCAYRAYLDAHPDEWPRLAVSCRVTITRFLRDRRIFDVLRQDVLPELAKQARSASRPLRLWSAGCASGEEPYSLVIAAELGAPPLDVPIEVVATDIDPYLIERARRGVFPKGALRELSDEWHELAFERVGEQSRLHDRFRNVTFILGDVRNDLPDGSFDVILCRNLAFTYFDEATQRRVLDSFINKLTPGGAIVVGGHETLPPDAQLQEWARSIHRLPRDCAN
jgi:chemotaxis protein methyltransferase CheR